MKHCHRIRKTEVIAGDDQRTFVGNIFLPNQFKITKYVKSQVNQSFENGPDE